MRDLGSMARSVAARLRERGETVSVTESSGGGLISAALLAIPGASAYFIGGGVIYTHEARRDRPATLTATGRDTPVSRWSGRWSGR